MSEIWIPMYRGIGVVVKRLYFGHVTPNIIGGWKFGSVYVIPESLAMQTGLKDANGVDIYGSLPGTRGGDVVEYWGEGEYIEPDDEEFEYQDGYRALVVYHGGRGYPAFDIEPPLDCDSNGLSHLIATGRIIVIGNAFQKPELLEAKE